WAIVEDVAQMSAAAAAMAFGADHEQRGIHGGADGAGEGFPEAGPARAAVIFGFGGIELLPAPGAGIDAGLVELVERGGEGVLGAVLAQDMILLGRQAGPPLFRRQLDFERPCHLASSGARGEAKSAQRCKRRAAREKRATR